MKPTPKITLPAGYRPAAAGAPSRREAQRRSRRYLETVAGLDIAAGVRRPARDHRRIRYPLRRAGQP